jgi:hypothetical protein
MNDFAMDDEARRIASISPISAISTPTTGAPNPDRDAHRQSAGFAGHPRNQYCRLGAAGQLELLRRTAMHANAVERSRVSIRRAWVCRIAKSD